MDQKKKYYVLEEDPMFSFRFEKELKNSFKNMTMELVSTQAELIHSIQKESPAFVVINTSHLDMDPLIFISSIRKLHQVLILYSNNPSSRFVVEALRLGVSDVIDSSKNDHFQQVKDIIVRAYLDGPGLARINKEGSDTFYTELNNRIVNSVFQDGDEKLSNQPGRLNIGEAYQTVFVGVMVKHDSLIGDADLSSQYNFISRKLAQRGGIIWPDRYQTVLCAFIDQDPRLVVEWLLYLYADFTTHLMLQFPAAKPFVSIGMSNMIYKESLNSVYSTAINQVSHMLKDDSMKPGLAIFNRIFRSLTPFQQSLFGNQLSFEGSFFHRIDF